MSTVTDQFTEFTSRTQDAVSGAVRTWAETVQSFASGGPKLPDTHVVVERYFDVARQMLDSQRAFATSVLDAGSKAAETVTGHAVNVTDTVTRKAAGAGATES